MSIEVNKGTPTNFQLAIPVLPGQKGLDPSKIIMLNIHNIIIPGVSNNMVDQPYLGANVNYAATTEFDPWEVSFMVDQAFDNWYYLYTWLMLIYNKKDVFYENFDNYVVDMTLGIKDNFKSDILRIKFVNAWITALSSVNLSYREGESNLECDATFAYVRYEVI